MPRTFDTDRCFASLPRNSTMAEVLEAGADGFDLSAKLDATSISTTMKTCSACHEDKPQDAFSKKA